MLPKGDINELRNSALLYWLHKFQSYCMKRYDKYVTLASDFTIYIDCLLPIRFNRFVCPVFWHWANMVDFIPETRIVLINISNALFLSSLMSPFGSMCSFKLKRKQLFGWVFLYFGIILYSRNAYCAYKH
jgi:hypothetical protein